MFESALIDNKRVWSRLTESDERTCPREGGERGVFCPFFGLSTLKVSARFRSADVSISVFDFHEETSVVKKLD